MLENLKSNPKEHIGMKPNTRNEERHTSVWKELKREFSLKQDSEFLCIFYVFKLPLTWWSFRSAGMGAWRGTGKARRQEQSHRWSKGWDKLITSLLTKSYLLDFCLQYILLILLAFSYYFSKDLEAQLDSSHKSCKGDPFHLINNSQRI